MWYLAKQKVVVILISIFISIYTVIHISTEQLKDERYSRPKREVLTNDTHEEIVSSSIVAEPAITMSEILTTKHDNFVTESASFVEISLASDIVKQSSDIFSPMESLFSSKNTIMLTQVLDTDKAPDDTTEVSTSNIVTTKTLDWNDVLSTDTTYLLDFSSSENVFVESSPISPLDLLSSLAATDHNTEPFYHSWDSTNTFESTNLESYILASSSNMVDESVTVSLSDPFPYDSDSLITPTDSLHLSFVSSDVSFSDENSTILSSSAIVEESVSDFFPSNISIYDESTTILPLDLFTSYSNMMDESSTVLPTDLFSNDNDFPVTGTLDSSFVSSNVSFSDETPTMIASSAIDDESVSDLLPSDTNIYDESTAILSSDLFTWNSNMVDESTTVLPTDLFSYDSDIPVTGTLHSSFSSSNVNFSEETPTIISSSALVGESVSYIFPSDISRYDETTAIIQSDFFPTSTDWIPETTSINVTTATYRTPTALPDKFPPDDEGLTTGGKIALGILIPVAIICLILFGLFFYRRYKSNRGSLKTFLHPGVRYRTYSNPAFKEDEVVVDGSWRSLSNH